MKITKIRKTACHRVSISSRGLLRDEVYHYGSPEPKWWGNWLGTNQIATVVGGDGGVFDTEKEVGPPWPMR